MFTRLLPCAAAIVLVLGCAHALVAEEAPPTTTTELRLPDGRAVTLELAATPQQRSLGLMFRPALTNDRGMLFLFSAADRHAIWMKNMLIPLDILWLNDRQQIVHIEANVPPCRREPCLVYQSPIPARYVIELAAGSAAQARLRPGVTLAFTLKNGEPPTASPPR